MNNNNEIGRRKFLKVLGGGVAASAFAMTACNKPNDQISTESASLGEIPTDKMTYRTNKKGEKVSILGYGCMRLPTVPGGSARDQQGEIDQETVNAHVDYAIAHGINYFDTSPAYCKGRSERVMGIALSRHKRDEYYIATKLSNFSPNTWSRQESVKMYQNSLKELQVDYIDYMLLHGIGMGGMESFKSRYVDNGMLDFLMKERQAGRIRNLGFSYHGDVAVFDYLLSRHDEIKWDFVQIQLNYVDWRHAKQVNARNTNAEYLYNELASRNIPVVIMEPLLGGRLASLNKHATKQLKERDSNASIASWAFRFAGSHPNVLTVLSGMTYTEHLHDNTRTFAPLKPLTSEEFELLEDIAQKYVNFPLISCTACQYCMPCPYGIDIPSIFAHYNKCINEDNVSENPQDAKYSEARRAFLVGYDRSVPKLRQANHCIGCNQCAPHCPQRINIPVEMQRIDKFVESLKRGDTQLGTAVLMASLVRQLDAGNYSCVINNNGETRTYSQRGIADLYQMLKTDAAFLNGACMADKVVGKGAASLMILGGIKQMHTRIISSSAIKLLRDAGVKVSFDLEVDHIINRSKTDWCPLEKRVKNCKTAHEALPIIEGFVQDLKDGKI